MQRKNRHHNRRHQRHKKSHAKKALTSTQLINTSLAKPAQGEAEDEQVAGIQRGFSIRPNLITLPAFISQLSYACADTIKTYFLSNNTNYRIDIEDEPELENALNLLVNNSTCGNIRTNLNSIAYDYLSIQKWTEVEDRGRMDSIEEFVAEFLRGVSDVAQEELESCIRFLLDEAYKALQAREQASTTKTAIIAGAVMGSIAGAALLAFGAVMLYRRWQRTHAAAAASPAEANEAGAASSSSNRSGSEKEPLLSKKNIFTIKEELKKLTLAERLKVIGVDLNKYPEAKRFICPITQEVMEDPVITDDGNTYEKATLMEQKQLNGTCPLDRSKRIKVMIPNNNLRAQIIEFVEAREAEAKNKIVKLPEKESRVLRRSY